MSSGRHSPPSRRRSPLSVLTEIRKLARRQRVVGLLAVIAVVLLQGCGGRREALDASAAETMDKAVGAVGGRSVQQCVQIENDRLQNCVQFAEDMLGCYNMYQVRYEQCQQRFSY